MRCGASHAIALVGACLVALACNRSSAAGSDHTAFHVGRPATDSEIDAWDIDVDGDGHGLPPGSGTAETGAAHYAQLCARCHGPRAVGSATAPQLIKPDSVSTPPRRNVATHWPYAPPLFDYIRRAMPPDRPIAYGADTIYAIVAYLLKANHIALPNDVADRATLPRVSMPSRSAFVLDDRRGGRELR